MNEQVFDTGRSRQLLPDGLDDMAPGPKLSAVLAELDHSRLNGHDLVVVIRAHNRQVAYEQARLYQAVAEMAHCPDGHPDDPPLRYVEPNEFGVDELRPALTLTRRAAEYEVAFGVALCRRLPQVAAFLRRGSIDVRKANVLIDGVLGLPEDTARGLVARVIDDAPGLTTGELRARLRRECVIADPEVDKQRYEHGLEGRRVVTQPESDGTASIHGIQLPPHAVTAIRKRIEQLARNLRRGGDEERTWDQLRADVFVDLLLGRQRPEDQAAGGRIQLRIDLETLAELNDHPGDIPGWGPVLADIARQIAQPATTWDVVVTDPRTGRAVWSGVTRRRPTTQQRRDIVARNPTCVFPGCRMPATDCDLDHRIRHTDGGPTTDWNQNPLCRHDHPLKDHLWRLRRLENGDYHWTSPLHHTYTTPGHPP